MANQASDTSVSSEREAALRNSLEAACALSEEWQRANALIALGPYLSETLLPQAVAAARALSDEWARALVLTVLIPSLPEGQRETVLAEALAAGRATSDQWRLAYVLASLAPFLSETLRSEALTTLDAISNGLARAHVLTALAPFMSDPLTRAQTTLHANHIEAWAPATSHSISLSPFILKLPRSETARPFLHPAENGIVSENTETDVVKGNTIRQILFFGQLWIFFIFLIQLVGTTWLSTTLDWPAVICAGLAAVAIIKRTSGHRSTPA